MMQMKRSIACAKLFQRAVHAAYRKEAGDGWGRLTKHEDHEAKKIMKIHEACSTKYAVLQEEANYS